MVPHPAVDTTEKLDAAAAEDDVQGDPVSCGAGMALGLLLAVATVTGLAIREQVVEQRKSTHAAGLVQRVLDAETAQLPGIVAEMAGYRQWTDPLLRQEQGRPGLNSRQKLHASLALLPVDATQVDDLCRRLLDAGPHEVPVIRDALAPHKDSLLDRLWAAVERPQRGQESATVAGGLGPGQVRPEQSAVGYGGRPRGQ